MHGHSGVKVRTKVSRVRMIRVRGGSVKSLVKEWCMALPAEVTDWLFAGIGVVLGWFGKLLHSWLGDKSSK